MIIYSKKNKKKILGIIFRNSKILKQRLNISPINEYLQVSTQKLKKNTFIHPHVHKKNRRITFSTQEIWLVLKGKLSINVLDLLLYRTQVKPILVSNTFLSNLQ